MRRSIALATVLAASTAIFGACEPKANAPESKPVVNSTPATTPVASPTTAPVNGVNGTPKAGTSPEVKKDVKKPETKAPETNVNKDVKPAANTNHK